MDESTKADFRPLSIPEGLLLEDQLLQSLRAAGTPEWETIEANHPLPDSNQGAWRLAVHKARQFYETTKQFQATHGTQYIDDQGLLLRAAWSGYGYACGLMDTADLMRPYANSGLDPQQFTQEQFRAIRALAITGDQTHAALLLGKSYTTVNELLSRARQRVGVETLEQLLALVHPRFIRSESDPLLPPEYSGIAGSHPER